MIRESPLAGLIPLWRTLREGGVTALVTPALDYVGGLELGTLDVRFAGEDQIAGIGEALRSLVASLDDETTLHFIHRIEEGAEEDIREYEGVAAAADAPALREYVAARARWLRLQRLRRARVYLFFSGPGGLKQGIGRGLLGGKLLFGKAAQLAEAEHARRLGRLAQLRDRVAARLSAAGIPSRELDLEDVWRLHYELLNPVRARAGAVPPRVRLKDTLWSERAVKDGGVHLAEYTEAEQLAHEDLEDGRGHFRQGASWRRVATLKVLPESGTDYFACEPLLGLATARGPLPYTLAVDVHVRTQKTARWLLNNQHALVESLRAVMPFLDRRTVESEEADRAKQEAIRGLFEELAAMSTKVVALSVSILLDAASLDELDAATEAARSAFAAAGNSELLVEEVTQVPAFLSMLPGAGRYQLRKKGCTSRNAADFLPVFAPWRGSARASSVLLTPTGEAFRFDLFDKSSGVNAHHGIVVADTGSGKSVTLGALTLDARAAGVEAILVDNGKSWKPLTELLGGVHIPVDLSTSISPFLSYAQLAGTGTEISNEEIEHVVQFLEVCVADRTRPPFDKVERDVVSRAIRWAYDTRFRPHPEEPPLVGHFSEALAAHPWTHPQDKAIADDLVRRLAIYCTGIYSEFLNRPSQLRFDAPLLTFDLAKISENAGTKAVAMATIIQAITNRAMSRRTRTLVEVDEGHEYLGADDATERFLGGCYRKMRKYDTAMWMISQNLNDFLGSRVGREAIVGNSTIRIFLRHLAGKHRAVVEHFGLSPRAAAAFAGLEMKPGWFSDFLLMYGPRTAVVRLALHPLAYWILTTDKEDQDFLARAAARNPSYDRLALLQELAARYPHGVVGRERSTRPAA
ncbi:VirB4 family type IV secretion system protein [Anaeromyxobacter sp. SG66]|uniref:VirB4 family type IV secretion system protein n=1 Tax=Anaeromyxobacter sp. SG66 TaxID=2925410 RepID=UPI001F571F83|nr:hypothetical protein [Anaeromyxobacter sp. SG66]